MKYFSVVFMTFFLTSCGGGGGSSTASTESIPAPDCEEPVELAQKDPDAQGIFVGIDESADVSSEAIRLVDKYKDLEIIAIHNVINTFIANADDETLLHLQCEENIRFLEYNKTISSF